MAKEQSDRSLFISTLLFFLKSPEQAMTDVARSVCATSCYGVIRVETRRDLGHRGAYIQSY